MRRRIAHLLRDQHLKRSASEICRDYVSNKLKLQLEYLASYRTGGWNLEVTVEGLELLQQAIHEGKGAILWVSPSTSSDLVVKRALYEQGLSVSHLSALTHGYSESKFGIRFLNRVKQKIENRYLGNRIVLDGSRSSGRRARDELERRVRNNEIVSITVVSNKGGSSLDVPFLSNRLKIGRGAPYCAHRTNAPLFPVFTVWDAATDKYRVVVEPPLLVTNSPSSEEAAQNAAEEFSDRLVRYVLHSPGQWCGWTDLDLAPSQRIVTDAVWAWLHKVKP